MVAAVHPRFSTGAAFSASRQTSPGSSQCLACRGMRAAVFLSLLSNVASLSATPRIQLHMTATVVSQQADAPATPMATKSTMLDSFAGLFQGHFDNHAQTVENQAAGLTPREGGGHEHIHCHVQPLTLPTCETQPAAFAIATYYFDGNPQHIFRQRLYQMQEVERDEQFGHCIQMSIYKLRTDVREKLRAAEGDVDAIAWCQEDVQEEQLIPGCDVFWRVTGDRYHGEMRTDSVVVESDFTGKPIVIRDDVSLWRDELWVNDRGADMEGNYLYGNVKGVPYKMVRVPDSHWTARGEVEEPPDLETWLSGC